MSGIIGGSTGDNLLSGQYPGILAGRTNRAVANDSVVAGGSTNLASGLRTAVIAGTNNQTFGTNAVIVGGNASKTLGNNAIVLGGASNQSSGVDSVTAGDTNIAYGLDSFIAGGTSSIAYGADSFIAAGTVQKAWGAYSSVLGGGNCVSSGQFSATVGNYCEAFPNGAHVFGDSTAVVKRAYGPDSLTLNYSGGTWITGGGLNVRSGFNLNPTGTAPTSSIGGRSGDFAYKDDYLYIFTGDNANLSNMNWGRVKLSSLTAAAPGQSIVSNKSSIIIPGGSPYLCTNAFANVTHAVDPWNPIAQNPSISVPAGNSTYLFDCQFLAKGGAGTLPVHYRLWNSSDSALINNSSGCLVTHTSATIQIRISTIVNLNYAASKTIDLQAFDADNSSAQIIPTGGFLRYIALE